MPQQQFAAAFPDIMVDCTANKLKKAHVEEIFIRPIRNTSKESVAMTDF